VPRGEIDLGPQNLFFKKSMKVPLLLLSGLLSNEILWEHQIRHLSDIASILVISSSEDTPAKMVDAILQKAPPKFALAGHSMGGWLCLELLKADPSRIDKLCLLNTTARPDTEEKKALRQKMISDAKEGLFSEIVDKMVDHFVFNQTVKPAVKKMFLQVGQEAFIRQQESMLARDLDPSSLSKVHLPTLVIHAAEDKNFSLEEHKELASLIKGAKLTIIEGSGHMSPMEKPEEITSSLRSWLGYRSME